MSNILLPITDLIIPLTHGGKDEIAEVGLYTEHMIDVEYHIDPGQREIIHKDPDDCQPGYGATMQIYRITAHGRMELKDDAGISLVFPSGTDITVHCKDLLDDIETQIWDALTEVEA